MSRIRKPRGGIASARCEPPDTGPENAWPIVQRGMTAARQAVWKVPRPNIRIDFGRMTHPTSCETLSVTDGLSMDS